MRRLLVLLVVFLVPGSLWSAEVRGTGESTDVEAELDEDEGETINGGEVLTRSINAECLDFEIVGICVWFTYFYYGYEIDYSVKVRHYIPDAVVTAYPETGKSPWTDVKGYVDPQDSPIPGVDQDGGNQKEHPDPERDETLVMRNVDVIGSPGIAWIEALQETGFFCDPATTMYFPYFLSEYDDQWRESDLEQWMLLLPPTNLLRHVDTGLDSLTGLSQYASWGPVFPRQGFLIQGHDYKAGAVFAQRAADITTAENIQPHLYVTMLADSSDSDQGQWPPGPVKEGDEETHRWQQLIPEAEADACRVFPDQSDQWAGARDPFADRISDVTGYAFNLWRPYECCEQEGAVLVFSIGGNSDGETGAGTDGD